jgi:UDP-N-acetylmuramyl pentapeptide phosphotransferase/UDP-N-acetylglucosamine-1-phosphate transferase
MFDKNFLYYSLFFITNFLLCFLILKLIVSNKVIFFNKIIIKKKSDYKMHSHKIYQNAGVIVIGLFLIISTLLYSSFYKDINIIENISRPIIFFISVLILYIMSIYDFKKNLHPIFRLIIQITLVYASLTLVEFPILPIEYFPLKIQYLLVIIFWVYIINIVNFVDGLDGLIGITAIGFFSNIIIFSLIFKISSINVHISILIIPFILAFLIFNKPKAKIFLNDVGSIPLGYIMGFCLLNILQNNNWYLFLSIFLYFILDVSYTLFVKIKKGYYPWARLFDYLFLQPVLKGKKTHWYVFANIFYYYLFMILTLLIIYFFQLNNIYLLFYSIISSLIIFWNFKKFN